MAGAGELGPFQEASGSNLGFEILPSHEHVGTRVLALARRPGRPRTRQSYTTHDTEDSFDERTFADPAGAAHHEDHCLEAPAPAKRVGGSGEQLEELLALLFA